MTSPNSWYGHYNQLSWGPTHYYTSALTGKRLAFRANEIRDIRPDFSNAIITTVGGFRFRVLTLQPELVR